MKLYLKFLKLFLIQFILKHYPEHFLEHTAYECCMVMSSNDTKF